MSNAERIYDRIRSGDPYARSYYLNLKRRIADGRRAEIVHTAIGAVHERRKNMKARLYFGADYPPGSYLTPNGKILTPDAIAQLANMIHSAIYQTPAQALAASPDGGGGPLSFGPTTFSSKAVPTSTSSLKSKILQTVSQAQASTSYK